MSSTFSIPIFPSYSYERSPDSDGHWPQQTNLGRYEAALVFNIEKRAQVKTVRNRTNSTILDIENAHGCHGHHNDISDFRPPFPEASS